MNIALTLPIVCIHNCGITAHCKYYYYSHLIMILYAITVTYYFDYLIKRVQHRDVTLTTLRNSLSVYR